MAACAADDTPKETHNLIIATATPGGTYYPVGVAVGTLVSSKLAPDITASAINSAGSGENIQMLVGREAQLAILQGLFGAMAYGGTGRYDGEPVRAIRSISMLWENVEHFILLKGRVKTGNVLDLKGLGSKFSIGKRGSGTEGSSRTILEALGIHPEDEFVPEYLGYTPSAQALMDGRIAGATIPAGPPAAAVTQVFAQLGQDGIDILEFTEPQLESVRAVYPVWNRHTIPAGTYPGQTRPIRTIAQPNFLACRADLPDDVVYAITRTIYENLSFLQGVHKATAAMSLGKAVQGLFVPLHPGAARYYEERGLDLPPDLQHRP
jgi:hypothetical protein